MHGDVKTCADLSAEQAAMKKFLVEYELPYVHLVRVGIQAKNEESAISIADQAFTDCTIWDNTLEMPLLYDDYEETGDSSTPHLFARHSFSLHLRMRMRQCRTAPVQPVQTMAPQDRKRNQRLWRGLKVESCNGWHRIIPCATWCSMPIRMVTTA